MWILCNSTRAGFVAGSLRFKYFRFVKPINNCCVKFTFRASMHLTICPILRISNLILLVWLFWFSGGAITTSRKHKIPVKEPFSKDTHTAVHLKPACAWNVGPAPRTAISARSIGQCRRGLAAAIITGLLTGSEPTCGCSYSAVGKNCCWRTTS